MNGPGLKLVPIHWLPENAILAITRAGERLLSDVLGGPCTWADFAKQAKGNIAILHGIGLGSLAPTPQKGKP